METFTMPNDPATILKLQDLLAAIRAYPDPRRASTEWKQAFNLLKKTDAESNHVANVVAMRGVDALAALIDELVAANEPASAVEPDPDAPGTPDDLTCKMALQAFRKRLKLMRLDEESKIDARNPLSKGGQSEISAIVPPKQWPAAVWNELVRRGKLRHTGKGFYELTGH
jgi:hypothetical protein